MIWTPSNMLFLRLIRLCITPNTS